MAQATSALMTTAGDTEVANNATYQMAMYTFNGTGLATVYAPNNAPSANLSAAGTAASGIDVLEVYSNNYLTKTNQNLSLIHI